MNPVLMNPLLMPSFGYYIDPMADRSHPPAPTRHTLLRLAFAAVSLALVMIAVKDYRSYRGQRQEVLLQAASAGLEWDTHLMERLRREPAGEHARLRLARALVSDSLSPERSEGRLERLELARRLSHSGLRELPASWEAPMLLGAATYLDWSLRRDGRLFREAAAWQDPLLHSLEAAPGQNEPTFFLALAYLELWPALSPEKRDLARGLVAKAMAEPPQFERLLEPWTSRAASREELLAAVPKSSQALRRVQAFFAQRQDWDGVRETVGLLSAARAAEAAQALAEGELRLDGRDLRGARHLLFTAASLASPGRASEALVTRALTLAPAGGFNPHYARGMGKHLDRALEIFAAGEAPFDALVMGRLALAAGELPPPKAALAALAAGDLPEAERLERRWEAPPWNEEWSLFRILRARELLRRGNDKAAAATLDLVSQSWRIYPVYWQTELALAKAIGDPGRRTRAQQALAALSRCSLGPRDWVRNDKRFRALWFCDQTTEGLAFEVVKAPLTGAVVMLRLDGDPYGPFVATPGGTLRTESVAEGGRLHVLELESLAGGAVVPGHAGPPVGPPSPAGTGPATGTL